MHEDSQIAPKLGNLATTATAASVTSFITADVFNIAQVKVILWQCPVIRKSFHRVLKSRNTGVVFEYIRTDAYEIPQMSPKNLSYADTRKYRLDSLSTSRPHSEG